MFADDCQVSRQAVFAGISKEKAHITKSGVTLAGIAEAAEDIEMRTLGMRVSLESLMEEEVPLPVIVPWRQKHFVVIYKITKNKIHFSQIAFKIPSTVRRYNKGR